MGQRSQVAALATRPRMHASLTQQGQDVKQSYAAQLAKWRARREKIREFIAAGNSLAQAGIKFGVSKARAWQITRSK